MKKFIISTDSAFDLPSEYIKKNSISVHSLNYRMDNSEYIYGENELDSKKFYDYIADGIEVHTSASNPYKIKKQMMNQVELGYDVLHISFSSALSSSYNNAMLSSREVMDEVSGSKIVVIDSLCGSGGLNLLIDEAVKMQARGDSIENTRIWIEENKNRAVSEFIVKDLIYLSRGGRVNSLSAHMGYKLNVRPILKLNNKGEIEITKKIRGNKRALNTIIENFKQSNSDIKSFASDSIYISHANSLANAEYIAEKLKMDHYDKQVFINDLTPTIGAHLGNQSIVLSYFSDIK